MKKNTKKKKLPSVPGFVPREGWLFDRAEELRKNQTSSEKAFGAILNKYGIENYQQLPVFVGNDQYIVDFVFRSETLKKWFACEIDGGYHKDEEQKKKDESRDAKLLVAGWIPIRMKNLDTNSPIKLAKCVLKYGAADLALKISNKGKQSAKDTTKLN